MKLNTVDWANACSQKHNSFYDYSFVDYKNVDTPVSIGCPIHGIFYQTPWNHRKGSKCPKCALQEASERLRLSVAEFVTKARKIHGDKFDYSEVVYLRNNIKVKIICTEHKYVFKQTPTNHLAGQDCPKCGLNSRILKRRTTLTEFLTKAKEVFKDKYDYSLITEEDIIKGVVPIKCKAHGIFYQKRAYHVGGSGCPKCLSSKGEDAIRTLLQSKGINFLEQKSFKDLWYRAFRSKLRYDFFIPSLNLLIEYDGHFHYKPSYSKKALDSLEHIKIRDKLKDTYALVNGYSLLRIPYYEENVERCLLKALVKS